MSGTVGSFAMLGVVIMVYGYFKYLKPFLNDWKKLKDGILEREQSYAELVEATKDVYNVVGSMNLEMVKIGDNIIDDIKGTSQESHAKLLREVADIIEHLKDIKSELEKKDDHNVEKMNQLMVELTKLNLRLEMNQNMGHLRGLK